MPTVPKVIHGQICNMPYDDFGFFAWPSITRLADGTLVVGASGLRRAHMGPWGKTVLFFSKDNGETWTRPEVINNSPLDDRDCGVLHIGDNKLIVTWFTSDTSCYFDSATLQSEAPGEDPDLWQKVFDTYDDELVLKYAGAWLRISIDGGRAWGDYIRTPVNAPHGPIKLASGKLLYLGKVWPTTLDNKVRRDAPIAAYHSSDDGKSWNKLGCVPQGDCTKTSHYCEAHVVELEDSTLVGLIRLEDPNDETPHRTFSMVITRSNDGGITWTPAEHTGIMGSPPHLLRHSSGAVICSFCRRIDESGEFAMISYDGCQTWSEHQLATVPPRDHGYPCSAELADGSIITVYYRHENMETRHTGLFYSKWHLPEKAGNNRKKCDF